MYEYTAAGLSPLVAPEGSTCAQCAAVLGASDPARRSTAGDWLHDLCPVDPDD